MPLPDAIAKEAYSHKKVPHLYGKLRSLCARASANDIVFIFCDREIVVFVANMTQINFSAKLSWIFTKLSG